MILQSTGGNQSMKKFTEFNFHMFTEIVFGKGTESKVTDLIRKHGGTKVMLVYGGGSVKKMGLYDSVVNSMKADGMTFVELSGVQPNPRRSLADEGLKIAIKENVDLVLAIGGGSTIDTAKAIALGLANDGDYWQFYQGTAPTKIAPVGAIPTIAAAGSETSGSFVIVDDLKTNRKFGLMHPMVRPAFTIMNPELTYSVSPYQTSVGSADIFAHVVMRYFIDSDCYLGDEYCEGTMRTVVKYAPIAYNNPTDYEARAELMLASAFGHNDLLDMGRLPKNRGGEHPLERQLSGVFDTPHGAGLAVVMPPMLQYYADNGEDRMVARVAQFGVKVFDVDPNMGDVKEVAYEGINRFRAWLKLIGMPLTLKELGIPNPKENLATIINNCTGGPDGVLPAAMPLDHKAVTTIYSSVVE